VLPEHARVLLGVLDASAQEHRPRSQNASRGHGFLPADSQEAARARGLYASSVGGYVRPADLRGLPQAVYPVGKGVVVQHPQAPDRATAAAGGFHGRLLYPIDVCELGAARGSAGRRGVPPVRRELLVIPCGGA
jgi:hypothetical protein